jgi:predicted nucleic acid-binding protein
VQIFGEFFHGTVIRRRLLAADEAERIIRAYQPVFAVVDIDFALVRAAIGIHRRFQLRYWDSLIVAAAGRSGCTEILSEGRQTPQPLLRSSAMIAPCNCP